MHKQSLTGEVLFARGWGKSNLESWEGDVRGKEPLLRMIECMIIVSG